MPLSKAFFLMSVLFPGKATAQSLSMALKQLTTQDGKEYSITQNTVLADTDDELVTKDEVKQFVFDIRPGAKSTLQYVAGVDPKGTETTVLTTPSTLFSATFEYGPTNVLAMRHLAQNGATLCNSEVFFDKAPTACSSNTWAAAACAQTQCGLYGKTKTNAPVYVVPKNKIIPCEVVVKVNTSTGWHSVCTNAKYEFSLQKSGATLHIDNTGHYTVFFTPRGKTSTEEFVVIMVAIVALMLWTSQSRTLHAITSPQPKGKQKRVVLAGQIADILFTLSFTATYAVTRTGITLVPTQTSIQMNHVEIPAIALYLVTTALAPAIAFAILMEIPHQTDEAKAKGMMQCARPFAEILLTSIIFLFLPTLAGEALRETIGLFLGIAACIIMARDFTPANIEHVFKGKSTRNKRLFIAVTTAWAAGTIFVVVVLQLTPVFVESAGIQNANAVLVASTVAAGALGCGIYLRDD